jgi:hypothetical protein
MTFNTSELMNASSVTDVAMAADTYTDGGYGFFILFVAFLVAFVSIRTTTGNTKGAFTAASFVCFIMGVILAIAGFEIEIAVWLCFAGFLVGAIASKIG